MRVWIEVSKLKSKNQYILLEHSIWKFSNLPTFMCFLETMSTLDGRPPIESDVKISNNLYVGILQIKFPTNPLSCMALRTFPVLTNFLLFNLIYRDIYELICT